MIASPPAHIPNLVLAWATVRYATFPDRVAAAAEFGFGSIGMMVSNYLALRGQGWPDRELLAVLDDHDVTMDEVEVLYGFSAPPGPANVPERPGLGVTPDLEAAKRYLVDTEIRIGGKTIYQTPELRA